MIDTSNQVKGYETIEGHYVVLEPEEIAAAVPRERKGSQVDRFIGCNRITPTYFDRPYYLLPSSEIANETFVLVREALRKKKVAAIAHAVLFRRLRPVLIRAHHDGPIATTLTFEYEVSSAKEAFQEIRTNKYEPKILELARHILDM